MLLVLPIAFFIFIDIYHVILIVGLENRLLISDTTTYSIVVAHDFSELVEVLENMNTDSSVEASRFQ